MRFQWYHVEDGVARVYADTPDIRARVDTEPNWYGSAEGPILHGGIEATAFERKVEPVFDGRQYFETGRLGACLGERVTTKITAAPIAA